MGLRGEEESKGASHFVLLAGCLPSVGLVLAWLYPTFPSAPPALAYGHAVNCEKPAVAHHWKRAMVCSSCPEESFTVGRALAPRGTLGVVRWASLSPREAAPVRCLIPGCHTSLGAMSKETGLEPLPQAVFKIQRLRTLGFWIF